MSSRWLAVALSLAVSLVDGASIAPSDIRGNLQIGSPLYTLDLSPDLPGRGAQALLPSTTGLYPPTRLQGRLVSVQPSNANKLKAGDIAFLSCDPDDYPGNIDPDDTLSTVLSLSPRPAGILLYTTHAARCDFSYNSTDEGNNTYSSIFTLRDPEFSLALLTSPTRHTATIATSGPVTAEAVQDDTSGSSVSGGRGNRTGVEATRNTAMIILYTVTGIITLLFLAVITTGAIRAHRHPDRYGPRNLPGRGRQSRVKGIARAVLDTIPIVKFGETPPERSKHDVEMASHAGTEPTTTEHAGHTEHTHAPHEAARSEPTTTEHTAAEHAPGQETGTTHVTAEETTHPPEGTAENAPEHTPADLPELESLICPICTDNFERGQDVRLLPCNHSFHPACVDPWLVDVSGTCPLCRVDLHRVETNSEGFAVLPPSTPADADVDTHLERARDLRSRPTTSAEERRRHRLSARFFERFRIRTHRHGENQQ